MDRRLTPGALAALVLAVQPATEATAVPEVTVVARLRRITYSYTARHGRLVRWRLLESTGEPKLDRLVEAAVRRCAAETPEEGRAIPACMERARPELRRQALEIEAASRPPAPDQ